jgi:FKBP-type peptidyl-prolyl cis-trans isomerase SlpA
MDKILLNDITLVPLEEKITETASGTFYSPEQLAPGREVSLYFELSLSDGEIVDSNFDRQPATFTVGDGNILPGFEQAIYGLSAGEESTVKVPAEMAFGHQNPDNLHRLPRTSFPTDLAMEQGLMINFTDSAGNDQPGVIKGFDVNRVTVDFNHPLAGRDILFRVKILTIAD